jgi:hypothetical protein
MLRFAHDLFCNIFRLEIGLVLSHASQWSEVTGIGVQVSALDNPDREPNLMHVGGLSVTIDTVSRRASDARELQGYLLRNLAPAYSVALDGQRVTIDWNARRPVPATTAPFQDQRPAPA